MTQISSVSASTYSSPLQRLQAQLAADDKAGRVAPGDVAARARDRGSVEADRAAGKSGESAAQRPESGGLNDKVGALLDGQVSSGALTSDQAKELRGVFEGAGGSKNAGRNGDREAERVASSATNSTAAGESSRDLVASFVQTLKDSFASSYSETGRSTRAASSLILDIKA